MASSLKTCTYMYLCTSPFSQESLLPYLFQLVYGQCILSVVLTQFQNLYSLEIRPDSGDNDRFCCCDVSSTCQYNLDQFSLDTCRSFCDTYFALSFLECQHLAPCPVGMVTDTSANSDTTTNVDYDFYFIVSSSAIEEVQS